MAALEIASFHPVFGCQTWGKIALMSDQVALWQQIESIKRRVQGILGEKPPRNFRSTFVYQNYTATCGEAFWAYKNQELDEDLLRMLQKDADKLIENWKNQ